MRRPPIDQTSIHQTSGCYSGFTLLEILVALAALLIGLLVISELMNTSLRQATRSEEQTEIQLICQNTMNEILSGAMPIASSQTVPLPSFPHWDLTVTVTKTAIRGLVAITITAQKYEQQSIPSSMGILISSVPLAGQSFVVRQWARLSTLKQAVDLSQGGDGAAPFSFTPAWPEGTDSFSEAGFSDSTVR